MKKLISLIVLVIIVILIIVIAGRKNDTVIIDESAVNLEETVTADDINQNIVELALGVEDLSTLVTAVQAAELTDTLATAEVTVFAPANVAFDALPEGTVDTLLQPEQKDALTDVLTYHVVSGKLMASDLSDGQELVTLQGQTLMVSVTDGVVMINGAKVVVPDILASNGVVHVIDSVLLPESTQ